MAGAIGVVMAGGQGTRLRPLTVTIPKPMLPVGSRAILEIILRQLRHAGLDLVYVSVGYRGYLVRSFLRELAIDGLRVEVLEEDEPLGTAGALALLPPGEGAVFTINGDILTKAPIAAAIAGHQESGGDLTMLVHRHPVPLPYGLVDIEDGAVRRIREKPVIDFEVATGMYVISRSVVDGLVRGERLDMPDLITSLISSDRPVRAHVFDELWTDVADLADFEKVNLNSDEWESL